MLTIPGLDKMLQNGFAVVATDYPGLGTVGVHPYLVGLGEGRAIIDSVRAARKFSDFGVGDRFVVWGYSQGGHAALFVGQIATSYAPELKLLGIATAAPPTDLATLLELSLSTPAGKILTSLTLWSWSRMFNAPTDSLLARAAQPMVSRIAGSCIQRILEKLSAFKAQKRFGSDFLGSGPASVEPWRTILARQTPSSALRAPIFIAQGLKDTIVDWPVTKAYAASVCRLPGNHVRVLTFGSLSHGSIEKGGTPAAMAWIEQRFNGVVAPSTCGG
jgi:alpha-beta hydrolase superfamily lysophospholipase